MKVAVMSDSHDNLDKLKSALKMAADKGCAMVLHCGDLVAPFVVRTLGTFDGPVHAVFGNNDGDRYLAQKVAAADCPNVNLHGEFAYVDAGGKRLAMTHYGTYARGMAALAASESANREDACDAAFFGHTHEFFEARVGGRLVLNPGELLGLKGAPTFCVYDTESDTFEKYEVP